jgi:putative methyltransferase (TIGR04325 family)
MHSPRALTALYLNLISRKQQISVLDFGGASGEIYFDLKRGWGLLYPNNVIWTVVDSLPGMQLGENFMIEGDQIDFSTTIPPEKHFDVLHVSTVFQYIPDIVGTVNNLLDSCTPDHIILTRLCAGSNPDFFARNYAFGKWGLCTSLISMNLSASFTSVDLNQSCDRNIQKKVFHQPTLMACQPTFKFHPLPI